MRQILLGAASMLAVLLLFIASMKAYPTAAGGDLQQPLQTLYGVVGGERACTYLPSPGVAPHHFQADARVTPDGAFIIERFYNRGISELSVLGYDKASQRYLRTEMSKSGSLDISVTSGPRGSAWRWTSIAGSARKGTVTAIFTEPNGSYDFTVSNGGGSGRCGPRLAQSPSP